MEFQENSTPIQHHKYMYKYQTNVVGKVHVEEVVEVISDIYLNRGSREFFFENTFDSVKFSSKSELSSRCCSCLKFSVLFEQLAL